MESKKVTVIIPVFNAEKFLPRAITSCLQQEAIDEIYIIDDASTDDTPIIIREFLETKQDRIKSIHNKKNLGPGASRNLALEKAKNEFVCFLDADDLFLASQMTERLEIFNDQTIDALYSPLVQHIERNPKNFPVENFSMEYKKEGECLKFEETIIDHQSIISHSGFIWRKNFLTDNGFKYSNEWQGEDRGMVYWTLLTGKVVYQKKSLVQRNITGENISNPKAEPQKKYAIDQRWFQIMLNQSFSQKENRFFLKRYLSRNPNLPNSPKIWRQLSQLFLLLKTLLFNPNLLKKIL